MRDVVQCLASRHNLSSDLPLDLDSACAFAATGCVDGKLLHLIKGVLMLHFRRQRASEQTLSSSSSSPHQFNSKEWPFPHGQLPQLPLVAKSASSASMQLPQSVSAAFLQQYQGSCSTNVLL
jgi:hypothetical protein